MTVLYIILNILNVVSAFICGIFAVQQNWVGGIICLAITVTLSIILFKQVKPTTAMVAEQGKLEAARQELEVVEAGKLQALEEERKTQDAKAEAKKEEVKQEAVKDPVKAAQEIVDIVRGKQP
jgi:membrane protein insertase Oxa1/YidC/SpoIIIJ